MFLEFLAWWYGPGWLNAWKNAQNWVTRVQRNFSVPELLSNLFSPWKQIVSVGGRSIDEKFRAALDNLVSRVIGFFVRILVLITAVLMMIVAAVGGLGMVIAWPFIPIAILYLLFRSIKG